MHRPEQNLRDEADQDQVGDHLRRDHGPGGLALRHDVAEADRCEHRDREVDRVEPVEWLGEGCRVDARRLDVRRGEGQEEERQRDGDGLDAAQLGVGRTDDRPDLPPDDDEQDQQRESQLEEDPAVGTSVQRGEDVEGRDDPDHRAEPRQGRAYQPPP